MVDGEKKEDSPESYDVESSGLSNQMVGKVVKRALGNTNTWGQKEMKKN